MSICEHLPLLNVYMRKECESNPCQQLGYGSVRPASDPSSSVRPCWVHLSSRSVGVGGGNAVLLFHFPLVLPGRGRGETPREKEENEASDGGHYKELSSLSHQHKRGQVEGGGGKKGGRRPSFIEKAKGVRSGWKVEEESRRSNSNSSNNSEGSRRHHTSSNPFGHMRQHLRGSYPPRQN